MRRFLDVSDNTIHSFLKRGVTSMIIALTTLDFFLLPVSSCLIVPYSPFLLLIQPFIWYQWLLNMFSQSLPLIVTTLLHLSWCLGILLRRLDVKYSQYAVFNCKICFLSRWVLYQDGGHETIGAMSVNLVITCEFLQF